MCRRLSILFSMNSLFPFSLFFNFMSLLLSLLSSLTTIKHIIYHHQNSSRLLWLRTKKTEIPPTKPFRFLFNLVYIQMFFSSTTDVVVCFGIEKNFVIWISIFLSFLLYFAISEIIAREFKRAANGLSPTVLCVSRIFFLHRRGESHEGFF